MPASGPIKRAVAYLKGKAGLILAEQDAALQININTWPQSGLSADQDAHAQRMRCALLDNKTKMLAASEKLQPKTIFIWADQVIALPEFAVEDAHIALDAALDIIRMRELWIEDLQEAAHHNAASAFSASRSAVDAGKMRQTNDNLYAERQAYQDAVKDYNRLVRDYSKKCAQVPQQIKDFVKAHEGKMFQYIEYQIRQDLVESCNAFQAINDDEQCRVQ